MTALALRTETSIAANDNIVAGLPALVMRAAKQLESSVEAAELLDAIDYSQFAYDAGKAAARLAKKQGAYSEVISAAYRAQADALEIESQAKRRLADEYDAAQARGEIRTRADNSRKEKDDGKLTPADIGVSYNEISDARKLRNALSGNPTIVRDVLDEMLADGRQPSRHALGIEINTRLSSFSGDNEWYTPAKYVDMAREVMGTIDIDPASNPTAQRTVRATTYYTAETNGLDKPWSGKVWMNPPYSNPEVQQFAEKVISEFRSGNISEAIVLTNNSADTGWHRAMQDACTRYCTTTGRIRFESPTRQGNSPAMGQSFFYFGDDPERFKDVFSSVGNIWALA